MEAEEEPVTLGEVDVLPPLLGDEVDASRALVGVCVVDEPTLVTSEPLERILDVLEFLGQAGVLAQDLAELCSCGRASAAG